MMLQMRHQPQGQVGGKTAPPRIRFRGLRHSHALKMLAAVVYKRVAKGTPGAFNDRDCARPILSCVPADAA